MKAAALHFGLNGLAKIYEEMGTLLEPAPRRPGGSRKGFAWGTRRSVRAIFDKLYARYRDEAAEAFRVIATYIRDSPGEFVMIDGA